MSAIKGGGHDSGVARRPPERSALLQLYTSLLQVFADRCLPVGIARDSSLFTLDSAALRRARRCAVASEEPLVTGAREALGSR